MPGNKLAWNGQNEIEWSNWAGSWNILIVIDQGDPHIFDPIFKTGILMIFMKEFQGVLLMTETWRINMWRKSASIHIVKNKTVLEAEWTMSIRKKEQKERETLQHTCPSYYGLNCVPQKKIHWNLNPSTCECDIFGNRIFAK